MEKQRLDADMPVTPVQVHAQYVKDFSFENPRSPGSLRGSNERPEMDVNIVLDANKIEDGSSEDLYESVLNISIKATRDGKILYITEISYAAAVTLKDVQPHLIKPILYIEVPQMLFPFARQMVASAVVSGGFPPLLLNPVDFRRMYADANRKDSAGSIVA